MQPIPYLFFSGNCAEAMNAYGEIFGARPDFVPFAAMPDEVKAQMPASAVTMVMHSALKVGEGWIYASDDPTGSPAMAGCNVHVSLPTVDEARRVFGALAEGGEVRMALEPTFWAPAFGTLSDRFGTRWMVSADAPEGQAR
jgi:PhnB protein